MFAALAVIVAFGVGGQLALAESVANPHVHAVVIGKRAPVNAGGGSYVDKAASKVHNLFATFNELPPLDSSGYGEWPCGGGGSDPDCSSIAAGGLVIGFPFYSWSLATCTSSEYACGELTWMFETDLTGTGSKWPINVSVTVTQGTTDIYTSGTLSTGLDNPGEYYTEVFALPLGFGPGDCFAPSTTCGTPVAGAATIKVTTTIGTGTKAQSATGTAVIDLTTAF